MEGEGERKKDFNCSNIYWRNRFFVFKNCLLSNPNWASSNTYLLLRIILYLISDSWWYRLYHVTHNIIMSSLLKHFFNYFPFSVISIIIIYRFTFPYYHQKSLKISVLQILYAVLTRVTLIESEIFIERWMNHHWRKCEVLSTLHCNTGCHGQVIITPVQWQHISVSHRCLSSGENLS